MPEPRELNEPQADRVHTFCHRREVDKSHLVSALPAEDPYQICIVHRVEWVILQGTFVKRHRADEEISLVDRAAGFGKSRRDENDRLARILLQRIRDRPDIAGICRVEGRTDLEQYMARAALAQPAIRGPRHVDRPGRRNRAALQRNHDCIRLGKREVARHADGLNRAQPGLGERVGKIGCARVVVSDTAERNGHERSPERFC